MHIIKKEGNEAQNICQYTEALMFECLEHVKPGKN
jgi:hypothetical protein